MTTRFSSILVAAELQQELDGIAAIASALAASAGVRVEVVALGSAHPAGSSSTRRELERRVRDGGLDAATWSVVPDDELVEHVRNRDGALLVLATTTWSASGVDLLDQVAEDVLARVVQPVLVVGPSCRPDPIATTPVMVVDGSEIADAAVPVVDAWVGTFRPAAVRIVEVVAPSPIPIDDAAVHVRRYVELLAGRGVRATGDVVRGAAPAREIATFAGTVGHAVVIVTSPRWAGGSHWFHTTRRLIRHSSAPVLIVPADLAGFRWGPPGSIAAMAS